MKIGRFPRCDPSAITVGMFSSFGLKSTNVVLIVDN